MEYQAPLFCFAQPVALCGKNGHSQKNKNNEKPEKYRFIF